jgi:hypothetical protein
MITKETVGSRARDGKAAELRGCGRIRKAPGLIVGQSQGTSHRFCSFSREIHIYPTLSTVDALDATPARIRGASEAKKPKIEKSSEVIDSNWSRRPDLNW